MKGFIDDIESVNVDSLSRVFFLFLLVYDFADDDLSLEIVSFGTYISFCIHRPLPTFFAFFHSEMRGNAYHFKITIKNPTHQQFSQSRCLCKSVIKLQVSSHSDFFAFYILCVLQRCHHVFPYAAFASLGRKFTQNGEEEIIICKWLSRVIVSCSRIEKKQQSFFLRSSYSFDGWECRR